MEIERYTRAYGAGAMKLAQYRKAMEDANKRRANYESQLKKLDTSSSLRFNRQQLETFCKMATEALQQIDPTNKHQVVRDLVDKVIIKESDEVEVCGHIDLKDQPEGLVQRHENWDRRFAKRRKIHAV